MPASANFGFSRPAGLSRRILLLLAAALTAAGTVLVSGATTVSAATQPVPQGLGGSNWTVIPATPKVVALTFDATRRGTGR